MPWEIIGDCGPAGSKSWMRLHRVWGIAYIKEVCGEPPPGCEVGEMWEDTDGEPAVSIGLRWDPTEIWDAPWDYISRAEVALRAMDEAIDWGILNPEEVRERINEAEATDIWYAAELEEFTPLAEWVSQRPESDGAVDIPVVGAAMDCPSLEQAKLVACLAKLGVTGNVKLPNDKADCAKLLELVNARLEMARTRFRELAESRTRDERVRKQWQETLERWFIVGRDGP